MAEAHTATGAPPRPRRRKWLRRLAGAGVVYLLCWVVTWALAPSALNRWWASHHNPVGHDLGGGNPQPVEFRTGVRFQGEGLRFGPDFTPQGKWWCCVGRPWCPVPFVVASEVAWVDSPLSGFAGRVWMVWTPFGLIPVHENRMWMA